MRSYRLKEVAELLGVAAHRIDYAVRRRQVAVSRPHKYAHHWYTWEEIKAFAHWFGVSLPSQKERTT
jgi:hypothetical protein